MTDGGKYAGMPKRGSQGSVDELKKQGLVLKSEPLSRGIASGAGPQPSRW